MTIIKLGLIGDNILSSSAPSFHIRAAQQQGIDLTYELILPKSRGMDFPAALAYAKEAGLRGVNVTLPYKEVAFKHIDNAAPAICQLGAINTICFDGDSMSGFNTDFSGFLLCYRQARGDRPAGDVLLVGAGGVGRSVAFGLLQLGAHKIRLLDKTPDRADQLAAELNSVIAGIAEPAGSDLPSHLDGVLNCSPAGMYGYDLLPLDETQFPDSFDWAFDAVYQPVETGFKLLATARRAKFISGFELFIHQGVDAFRIFTGLEVNDLETIRLALFDTVHHKQHDETQHGRLDRH